MEFLVLLLCLNLLGGVYVFCFYREHLLTIMLVLELMVLMIFFCLILSLGQGGPYYSLFYLVVTACEGALGLSLLVMMSRSYGGDYLSGMGAMFF